MAAFLTAAAAALARVGPTHASRLAAVRWTPWAGARAQRLQDAAALIALKMSCRTFSARRGSRWRRRSGDGGREEKRKGATAKEEATDAQAEAARAIAGSGG